MGEARERERYQNMRIYTGKVQVLSPPVQIEFVCVRTLSEYFDLKVERGLPDGPNLSNL